MFLKGSNPLPSATTRQEAAMTSGNAGHVIRRTVPLGPATSSRLRQVVGGSWAGGSLMGGDRASDFQIQAPAVNALQGPVVRHAATADVRAWLGSLASRCRQSVRRALRPERAWALSSAVDGCRS